MGSKQSNALNHMETLTGSVERITYYNEENGYSVIRLRPDRHISIGLDREGLATVTGNLPQLIPGEYLRLNGQWTNHPVHGLQFTVETCEQALPATVGGIRRYLGSGLVKGIGPRLAERIVARFGEQTLEVIENQPERLLEVADIGPKRVRQITEAWVEQKQVKDIMIFLHSYGVNTSLAVKIYKQYNVQALQIVQQDPYRLARDVYGIGFKTADKIARALGLAVDHPSRLEAALVYVLNQMSDEGHVYVPRQELAESTAELLELPVDSLLPALERLQRDGRVIIEDLPRVESETESTISPGLAEKKIEYSLPAVYLSPFYYSEVGLADRLSRLASTLPSRLSDLPPAFIALDTTLSPEQQAAVRTALTHPVSILTGGPGTGKTTTIRALIQALSSAGKRFALASPTGRAAKRLSEATGEPASTIHRLLGYSPGEGFKFNDENPLQIDLLVVDEASMLDLLLANTLLKALEPGTHLLLVGDVDQLPSVGAGDVLRDIIASDLAPVTRLTAIFRQATGSHIIVNAHRVNQGQLPLFSRESQDFFLFPADDAEDAAKWVQEVVCVRIPDKFGLNPIGQVQVLAPMYRGPAGVHSLNVRLQAVLNPPSSVKPEKSLFGVIFRQGDKVMQTQNNYDKEVYNGDIGRVAGIDLVDQTLTINIDGRPIRYEWSEADQLVLAYAISVHKAQGSEFTAIVMPLVSAHYMMLQRNLLYTGITRAKQLCVLVGNQRALGMAVRNNKVAQRYTALEWRLHKF